MHSRDLKKTFENLNENMIIFFLLQQEMLRLGKHPIKTGEFMRYLNNFFLTFTH